MSREEKKAAKKARQKAAAKAAAVDKGKEKEVVPAQEPEADVEMGEGDAEGSKGGKEKDGAEK